MPIFFMLYTSSCLRVVLLSWIPLAPGPWSVLVSQQWSSHGRSSHSLANQKDMDMRHPTRNNQLTKNKIKLNSNINHRHEWICWLTPPCHTSKKSFPFTRNGFRLIWRFGNSLQSSQNLVINSCYSTLTFMDRISGHIQGDILRSQHHQVWPRRLTKKSSKEAICVDLYQVSFHWHDYTLKVCISRENSYKI